MHFNPLPQVIRKIRSDRGLTQDQLADRVGVQQPTISGWENGKARPNLKTEQKIFRALEATDAEIGEALYQIVTGSFGYGRGDSRPQPAPGRLAKLEKRLQAMADGLEPDVLESYEKDIGTARTVELAYKQVCWRLEDRLSKESGRGEP